MSDAPDKSKFSLAYLIKGEGAKDWYKALGNGWRIAFIFGLALLLFLGVRSLMPKPQKQVIKVEKGGVATIIQSQDRKRFIIPFVEGGAEARDKEKIGAFIRGGVRFEW